MNPVISPVFNGNQARVAWWGKSLAAFWMSNYNPLGQTLTISLLPRLLNIMFIICDYNYDRVKNTVLYSGIYGKT